VTAVAPSIETGDTSMADMRSDRLTSTRATYLALEAEAQTKHEYIGGEIIAMAGAWPRHNVIAGNVVRHRLGQDHAGLI
jgi:Uma2 family endonuclease